MDNVIFEIYTIKHIIIMNIDKKYVDRNFMKIIYILYAALCSFRANRFKRTFKIIKIWISELLQCKIHNAIALSVRHFSK